MQTFALILQVYGYIEWFVKPKRIVLSTIIVGFIFLVASCNGDMESYVVKEEAINEAVYASGEILPEQSFLLKGISTERISQIMVREGDFVKKEDILVYLGTSEELKQVEIAQEQLTFAKKEALERSAILDELKLKIELANQKYILDKKNADRYNFLLKDKAVSAKEAEQYSLIAESSYTAYTNLQQQYTAKENELANKVRDAQMVLAQVSQLNENKVLRSKVSGKVYSIQKKIGEVVNSGETILLIGSENKYKLELLVDERDMSKMKIGQKVYFETDISKNHIFEGVISKIDPLLQKDSRSFKVEASITSNSAFFPQSTVEANIMIRENEKSILIPFNYLLEGDSLFCHSADGELKKIKVLTGIRNDNFIEITNGLKIGNIIYKYGSQ